MESTGKWAIGNRPCDENKVCTFALRICLQMLTDCNLAFMFMFGKIKHFVRILICFALLHWNWHLIWADNHISCRCIVSCRYNWFIQITYWTNSVSLRFRSKTSQEISQAFMVGILCSMNSIQIHRPRLLHNMSFSFAHGAVLYRFAEVKFVFGWFFWMKKLCLVLDFGLMNTACSTHNIWSSNIYFGRLKREKNIFACDIWRIHI